MNNESNICYYTLTGTDIGAYTFKFYFNDTVGNMGNTTYYTKTILSEGGGGGGGGGGGILPPQPEQIIKKVVCGDGICDEEESPQTCPEDCGTKLLLGFMARWEIMFIIGSLIILTLLGVFKPKKRFKVVR